MPRTDQTRSDRVPVPLIRSTGLLLSIAYGALIVWVYASQPSSGAEVIGGLAAGIGAYHVDAQAFDDGLTFFRQDKFPEARMAFERADPARRDARTQFYIAYAFYRQGWGRLYNDDGLFKQGIEAVDRAIALADGGRLVVDDQSLQMRTAEELKVELQRGIRREASDLNPARVFESRK